MPASMYEKKIIYIYVARAQKFPTYQRKQKVGKHIQIFFIKTEYHSRTTVGT
jgi:hypothetical protein